VCLDQVSQEDLFIFRKCAHVLCRDCARGCFNQQIENNEVHPGLICPLIGCKHRVPDEDLELVLSPEMLLRFEELRFKKTLMTIGNFYCCLTPGCENGVVWQSEEEKPLFKCGSCKKEYCLKCQDKEHEPASCESYQQWKKENGQTENLLEELINQGLIKRCPYPKCRAPSQKQDGCNFLTCRQCSGAWCWQCGQTHKACGGGHNSHK